jgi:uncharacterized repeat protein (TIGR03803 family)
MGIKRSPRARSERLECRVLLSGYTLSQVVSYLGGNPSGTTPRSSLVADAQGNLYGTTSKGGANGGGTVFEVAKGTHAITTLASFDGTNGQAPYAGVLLDSSGNLYGTATAGGALGEGTVFEVASGSNAITALASFNGNNGSSPEGGVTLDAAGDLYGTTSAGAAGHGTIFEIAHDSNAITTLAVFLGFNGDNPEGQVALDGSGNLYGTTSEEGTGGYGTIFEVAGGSGAITTLASFNGPNTLNPNGSNPTGALALDTSGNLYGATSNGGTLHVNGQIGYGSVFEVAAGSNAITTLASFTGANGSSPGGGVIRDASGDLFGTTQTGGASGRGTAFEIAAGTAVITTLVSFDGANGSGPMAAVTLDAIGTLYGTSSVGGANGQGAVFEVARQSGVATVLASFLSPGSANPYTGVSIDASGQIYGTSIAGGNAGNGTVFAIAPGSNVTTTLASFDPVSSQLASPFAVTLDAAGNLYGTTYAGGDSKSEGTIFEVPRGSNAITTLALFDGTNGANPVGKLTIDAAGNLVGTTATGGANNHGTVFELAAGSTTITSLASFTYATGHKPDGGAVTFDAAGNLYGSTYAGGAGGYGAVYEVAKGSNTITTLASFNNANGQGAEDIALDPSGDIYGAAYGGGASGYGTVFAIASGSATITTIASFSGANGKYPYSGVTLDVLGNLFGTTYGGDSYGTAFEIARGTNTITTLVNFSGANGQHPTAALVPDAFGNLYGVTEFGGAGGAGTIFKLNTNTAVALTKGGDLTPYNASTPLSFNATVIGGVPDGEALTLLDASNNDTVLAVGTLFGGSAALSVAASALQPGTHDLVAVYAGDANFAASESAAYAQVVQAAPPTLVGAPVINGDDPNGLFTAAGQGTNGKQRSMVEDIVYTFNEPVTIPDANAAFTVAVAGPAGGMVPSTLFAQTVAGSNGTQWAVSLSGKAEGTLASIANGEYSIQINPAGVFAAADGTTAMAAGTGRTDTFFRLFGDIDGNESVSTLDYGRFKQALNGAYNPAFDYDENGSIATLDYGRFKQDMPISYFGDNFVTTI